ncbi:MAG: hypothetical protein AAGL90_17315, partial [Pseudomonadota bacterium]
MQWLVANMWMALATAAVLGLLLGFSFRGLFTGTRARKANVEREIARTELSQSKEEIEGLYAAQRKYKEETAQAQQPDPDLVAALDARDQQIASLEDELNTAREELHHRTSEPVKLAETDPPPSADPSIAAVSTADQAELVQLRDRNDWLESRVGDLEADLVNAASSPLQAAEPTVEPEIDPTVAKTKWQADYLRLRVSALEEKLAAASTAALAAVATAEAPEPEPNSELDEELARLRWRNRYLEGRLAYFEESADSAETELAPATAPADPL